MPEKLLTFGSLFAGIGGFDGGFEAAGMRCRWQVEIDDVCNHVLERYWPEVKRYRDVRGVNGHDIEPVEVICAGFPCQDLSTAGKRNGLRGERSRLFFEVVRLVKEMREKTDGIYPTILVLENVTGLLSSNRGRDYAVVLREVAESGALDIAWAVLDAQWFGVAQQRRRVFVVADFRGKRAGEILSIPYGSKRDSSPNKKKRQVSPTLLASGAGTSRPAGISSETNFLVPVIANTLTTRNERMNATNETFIIQEAVAVGLKSKSYLSPTLRANQFRNDQPGSMVYVINKMLVRRLTPLECERLQGFPDGWTANIKSDLVRYRMLGNAVCRNVAEWIGKQIVEVVNGGS